MLPVCPGSTRRVHSPAVVQPQVTCTLLTWSVAPPTLVNTYVYLTNSPLFTLPKSYIGVANCIFGPETPIAPATTAPVPTPAVAVSNGGTDVATLGAAATTPLVRLAVVSPPLRPLPALTAYRTAATTTTAPPIQSARPFVPPVELCTG